MADIFISYRRRDNAHAAGRLYDQLAKILGVRKLFMDIDCIPPGADFVNVLESYVAKCKVLLAVIGPGWTLAQDERGQLRLWNPNDFVRIEILAALNRGIPVVPILIDGASLPRWDQLPEQLRPLLRRNAVNISHETFASDVLNLVSGLRPTLAPTFNIAGLLSLFRRRDARSASEPYSQNAPYPGPVENSAGAFQDASNDSFHAGTLVEDFFRERILVAAGENVKATELYEAFCEWCDDANLDPIALPSFAREFSEMGVRKEKIAGRVQYMGIEIRHV